MLLLLLFAYFAHNATQALTFRLHAKLRANLYIRDSATGTSTIELYGASYGVASPHSSPAAGLLCIPMFREQQIVKL